MTFFLQKTLILFFIAIFTVNVANAQWQQTSGPFGGEISALASTGSTVFAGTTENGVFRSTNNGTDWTMVNNGLSHLGIEAIACNGSNVYAGTFYGIFFSGNNGDSWVSVNNNLSNPSVECIVTSGNDVYIGTWNGVYMSSNNGTTWTSLNNGIPSGIINTLAISGQRIFAGTSGNGVYLSVNGGAIWNPVNNGLPANISFYALAFNGTTIFAGACSDGSVYRSDNNGASWTAANNGLTDLCITTLNVNENIIYAGTQTGIFFSSNNGDSWSESDNGLLAGTFGSGVWRRQRAEITGMKEAATSQSDLLVYPNPATNVITIDFMTATNTLKTIEIYDIQGVKRFETQTAESTIIIDVADYPSGIYFVKMKTSDSNQVQRFCK